MTDQARIMQLMEADWRRNRDQNFQSVHFVYGPPGVGKSWGCQRLATVNPKMSLDDIVFNAGQLIDRAREAPRGSILILDEAIRGAMSLDVMKRESKALQTLLNTDRFRNHTYFFLMPSRFDLSSKVRQLVDYEHRYVGRGRAVIHKPIKRDFIPVKDWSWPALFGYTIGPQEPPLWDGYLEKKDRMSVQNIREVQGKYVPPEEDVRVAARKIQAILNQVQAVR